MFRYVLFILQFEWTTESEESEYKTSNKISVGIIVHFKESFQTQVYRLVTSQACYAF